MSNLITGSFTAPTLRNKTVALDDPTASVTHVPQWVETVAGTVTDNTVDDAVLTTSVNPTGYYEGNISVTHNLAASVTFTSLDPAVATVDASGNITRVANGIARINATLPSGITLQTTVDVSIQTPSSVTVFKNWVTGSLAKHVTDAMLALVNGVTASDATKRVFNTEDRNPTARNASCWAASINLTGTAFNLQQAGTAITNRHVVLASHFPIGVGTVLKFMTADNTIITRTVIGCAAYAFGGGIVNSGTSVSNFGSNDWQICTLSESLPVSITPFKVFGGVAADFIPGLSYGVPILSLDQNDHAIILEWYAFQYAGQSVQHRTPRNSILAAFWEGLIVGDSGDPVFVVVNGEAALLGCHTTPASFMPFTQNLAALYALIDAADTHAGISPVTGLRPTLVDLSDFTNFNAD